MLMRDFRWFEVRTYRAPHISRFVAYFAIWGAVAGAAWVNVARANTYTWLTTGGTAWSVAADWTTGVAPGSGDIAQFTGTSYPSQPTVDTPLSVGGVWVTGTSALTLSGTSLTLAGITINGNAATGIEMDSGAGSVFISAPLVLGGAQTWLNNSSNLLTISGSINNGGNLLTINGSGNESFLGLISGAGGLSKAGAGILTVGPNSIYAGTTTVSGGTLAFAGLGNNLAGAINLSNGATLSIPAGASLTSNGAVSGNSSGTTLSVAGSLTASAVTANYTENFNISGVVSTTGALTVSTASTDVISGAGSITAASVSITNYSIVNFGSSGTILTTSGAFHLSDGSGLPGTFNQSAGTVNLTIADTTDIRLGHWGSETSTYSLSGGLLAANNGSINIGWDGAGLFNQSGGTLSAKGLIIPASGHAGLNGSTASSYTLTGGRLYLGSGGITQGGGTGTLNLGGGTITANSSTVAISSVTGNLTGANGNVTFDTNGDTIAVSSVFSGTGGLNKIGLGQLQFTGAAATYTGPTNIYAGTVKMSNATGALPSKSDVTIASGATLYTDGSSFTIGSLSGAGTVSTSYVHAGTDTLSIGNDNASTSFSGSIIGGSGTGSGNQAIAITKVGTGTLTLAGSNSYAGTTTVSRGSLVFGLAGSASVPQSFSSLTMAGPETSIQAVGGVSGSENITFASLTPRISGNTSLFATSGANSSIFITGGSGFIDQGTFFGGSNYAYLDPTGNFIRGINYASDTSAAATAGSISGLPAGSYLQMTGPVSGQSTASLTSLNISGNNNLTLSSGTLSLNGILKSGGVAGGATISGGAVTTSTANAELVVRTDQAADALTINSPILANGTNALTKSGLGALTLGAANTYTGLTKIDAGTLFIANSAALQFSTLDSSYGSVAFSGITSPTLGGLQGSGNISLASSLNLSIGANNSSTTYSGVLSGAGSLTKVGTGTLLVSAANTSYSGVTTVSSGVLQAGGPFAFGSYSNTQAAAYGNIVVQNGGTFDINGQASTGVSNFIYGLTIAGSGSSGQGALINNGAGGNSGWVQTPFIQLSNNASIGGSGSIYMINSAYSADTLNLNGLTLTKTGANSFYLADTTVTAGTVSIAQGIVSQYNTASNAAAVDFVFANTTGAGLTLNNLALAVGSITGGGSAGGNITLGTATLTVGGDGNSPAPYLGVISGAGNLTKVGTGTLTLAGSNAIAGTTTISGGSIVYGSASSPSFTQSFGTLTIAGPDVNLQSVLGTSGSELLTYSKLTRPAGSTGIFSVIGGLNGTSNKIAVTSAATGFIDQGTFFGGSNYAWYDASGFVRAINYASDTSAATTAGSTTGLPTGSYLQMTGPVTGQTTATISTINISGANNLTLSSGSLSLSGVLKTSGGSATISGGSAIMSQSSSGEFVFRADQPTDTLTISTPIIANGANVVTKSGLGYVTLSGAGNWSGSTYVNGGTLEVDNRTGNSTYNVAQGATLKMGYSSGGGYSNLGFVINGSGTASSAGLYVAGGVSLDTQSDLIFQTAPSIVRSYGTGNATLYGFDVNGTHIWSTAAASGTIISSSVNISISGYGENIKVDPGTNTATGDLVVNSVISGGGSNESPGVGLQKYDAGSLTLTASNTYTSGTAIRGGSIILSGGNNRLPIGTGVYFKNSSQLVLNGINQTITGLTIQDATSDSVVGGSTAPSLLTINDSSADTFTGVIGGSGTNQNNLALAVVGTSTLTLTGTTNSFTGGTSLSTGILSFAASSLGSSGTVAFAGPSTLQWYGTNTQDISAGNRLMINDGVAATLDTNGNTVTLGSPIQTGTAATGSLTKVGVGTLILGGSNAYIGGTTVSVGTLQAGNNSAIGSGNLTVASSALFDLHGYNVAVNGLNGGGRIDNLLGSGSLSIGYNNTSSTFNGVIQNSSGSLSLTKAGNGSIYLTANNTIGGPLTVNGGLLYFSGNNFAGGTTTINAGSLVVAGSLSGTSPYLVNATGSLGGIGAIGGPVTVSSSATLAAINPTLSGVAGAGTISLGGLSLANQSNAIFDLSGSTVSGNSLVSVGGALSLTGTTTITVDLLSPALASNTSYPLFTFGSLTGTPSTEFTLAPGAANSRQTTSFSTSGNTVYLNVMGNNQALVWLGTNGNQWNTLTSNLAWINSMSNADYFVTADSVSFTNSSSVTGVNISSVVSPSAISITGSNSYTFSGSGSITGLESLTINSIGITSLGTSNSFSGGTTILSGTLAATAAGALPTAGAITLGSTGSSGVLDLAGGTQQSGNILTGSGAIASNQIIGNSSTASNALLTVNATGVDSFGGIIQDTLGTGNQKLALSVGSGTLLLMSSSTYTGPTAIAAGATLQIGGGAVGASIASLSVSDSGTLAFNQAEPASSYAGLISGSGGVTVASSGVFTLTNSANSYTGGTQIAAGVLSLVSTGEIGSTGTITMTGGSLQYSAANTVDYSSRFSTAGSQTWNINTNSQTVTYATPLQGTNSRLNMSGSGTLILGVAETYTGPTTVTGGGILAIGVTIGGGSGGPNYNYLQSSSTVTVQNSTLQLYDNGAGGGYPTTNIYTLNNFTLNNGTLNLTGQGLGGAGESLPNIVTILGSDILNKSGGGYEHAGYLNGGLAGSGNLTINTSSNPSVLLIQGNMSGFGGTMNTGVNSGGISIESAQGWGVGSTLSVSSGTVWVNNSGTRDPFQGNYSQTPVTTAVNEPTSKLVVKTGGTFDTSVSITIGSLNGNGGTINMPNGSALTVGALGTTDSYSGSINGTASFTKTGSGFMALSGNNGYSNGTQISGGTLQLGSNYALPYGALAANAGVLDLNSYSVSATSFSGAAGVVTDTSTGATSATTLTINQYGIATTFGGSIRDGVNGTPLALTLSGGSLTLTGTNAFSGALNVSGVLSQTNSAALPTGATASINGTLDLGTKNASLDTIIGYGTIDNLSGSGSNMLTVGAKGGSSVFNGSIQNTNGILGLYKTGSGSFTLGNNNGNTYSGPTTMNAGTLVLSNNYNSSTGTGNVILNGGTLATSSYPGGTIGGNLLAGSGPHVIAPGGIGGFGTLTVGGSVSLNSNSTLDFNVSGTNYNNLAITGGLAVTGTANIDLSLSSPTSSNYILATFANSPLLSLSEFNISGLAGSGYTLSLTGTDLALVLPSTGPATWSVSSSGSWNTASNWSTNPTVPNGVGVLAVLGSAITSPTTITLDAAQTVGTLTFANSAAGYTLTPGASGNGTLTLDNTGGPSFNGNGGGQIIVLSGTHSIAAPLIISNSAAYVSIVSGGSLDISGNISETGGSHSLSLSSSDASGVLSLDGSNSFSGGVYVNSGTLILNGANALAPGSTLVIGTTVPPSAPTVLAVPSAAPAPSLAPVPEPGTLTLFGVVALWSAVACYRFSRRPA